jgi:hypothetical protein
MEQDLAKLAEQISKLGDTTQIQKDLENKAGLSEEDAKKLLDQLKNMDPKQLQKELQKRLGDKATQQQVQQLAKKIQQNQAAQQACKNLAQQLAKASQACQQCQKPGQQGQGQSNGTSALSSAADQLSELEMTEQMLGELQAQLADLDQARDNIGEGKCQGPGKGKPGDKIGEQGPQYGLGMGERIGKEASPHKFNPEKAKTRYEGGVVIGQVLVSGPQSRGEASDKVYDAALSEVRDAEDAVEQTNLPRQYHKSAKAYFEQLAGLLESRRATAKDDQPAGKAELPKEAPKAAGN